MDVTPAGIVEQVKALYEHPEKLQSMAKHAAELAIPDTDERIYKVISSLQKA